MLYPINIEIERKKRIQKIKETLHDLKSGIKGKIKYLIFDRKNLKEKILVKIHI